MICEIPKLKSCVAVCVDLNNPACTAVTGCILIVTEVVKIAQK